MEIYVVRSGDNLFSIAQQFGTTVEELIRLNNLGHPNNIRVGQRLMVSAGATGGTGTRQQTGGTFASRVVRGLRYVLTTDRRQYRRGEQVRITFIKCNITSSTIRLNYNTGQRFDVVALRDGRVVWRWSDDRFFTQARGTETLRPGDCRTYTATWDLRNRQGNFVTQGDFTIRAENVATQLRNQFIQTQIEVGSQAQPPTPSPGRCPRTNMLANPGFESWVSNTSPRNWVAVNVRRSGLQHGGSYAAEMGADSDRQSELRQSVLVGPRLNYQITFWARERLRGLGLSRFILEAAIYLYDRNGRFIGRVDPTFSPTAIPDNTYQQFRFTTGVMPAGADRAELRFIFRPRTGNTNSVIIDDVSMICVS